MNQSLRIRVILGLGCNASLICVRLRAIVAWVHLGKKYWILQNCGESNPCTDFSNKHIAVASLGAVAMIIHSINHRTSRRFSTSRNARYWTDSAISSSAGVSRSVACLRDGGWRERPLAPSYNITVKHCERYQQHEGGQQHYNTRICFAEAMSRPNELESRCELPGSQNRLQVTLQIVIWNHLGLSLITPISTWFLSVQPQVLLATTMRKRRRKSSANAGKNIECWRSQYRPTRSMKTHWMQNDRYQYHRCPWAVLSTVPTSMFITKQQNSATAGRRTFRTVLKSLHKSILM